MENIIKKIKEYDNKTSNSAYVKYIILSKLFLQTIRNVKIDENGCNSKHDAICNECGKRE